MPRKKNGFTLIELLVVVAIIGLLASIVMASLNSARSKARDSRRKADIHQIQNALELYNNTYGGYPVSAWNDSGFASYNVYDSISKIENFAQFMPTPHDPQYPNVNCYNAEYAYMSDSYRTPGTLATKYVLYATLENQSTTNLNPVDQATTWYDYQMTHYSPNGWACAGYGLPNYRVGDLIR